MTTFAELMAQGDEVDEELVSLLAAEGVETPEAAHALGEDHWVALLAEREGFDSDLDGLLANLELTWEDAANAERLQQPLDQFELGIPTWTVAEKLGAKTLADVYRLPRAQVRRAMADRTGMLAELTGVLGRQGLSW